MTPRRRLVLVTQSHPFGEYVDFLEEELDFLADAFDAVVVAPFAPAGAPQDVPANVTVDLQLACAVTSRRRRIMAGLRRRDGRALLAGDLRSRVPPRRHPESLARLCAAAGMAAETARWANRLPRSNASTLAMTVWLGAPTVGLAAAGLRTVSRAHRGDLYEEIAPRGYLPLQSAAIDSCRRVFAVSDEGRADLARRHPGAIERLATRRLGVRGAVEPAAWSVDGVTRILSCSTLTSVKRPHLLVDVVAAVGADGSPVEWHHYGAGPLATEVADRASTLPPNVSVSFHGHVPNTEVLAHYELHPVDVFLNVSSSEGVPVTIMEAISAGVPVVATDVGGVSEIVDDRTGSLVPSDAVGELIAVSVRSEVARAHDPTRRAEIRASWQQRYSSRRNYEAFAAELAALAENSSG